MGVELQLGDARQAHNNAYHLLAKLLADGVEQSFKTLLVILFRLYAHHIVQNGCNGRIATQSHLGSHYMRHLYGVVEHRRTVVTSQTLHSLLGKLQRLIHQPLRSSRKLFCNSFSQLAVSLK